MVYELKLLNVLPSRERFLVDSSEDKRSVCTARPPHSPRLSWDRSSAQFQLPGSDRVSPIYLLGFSRCLFSGSAIDERDRSRAHFLSKLTIFSANLGVYFTLPDRLIPKFPGASLRAHRAVRPATMLGYPPISAKQPEILSRTASSRFQSPQAALRMSLGALLLASSPHYKAWPERLSVS